MKAIKEASRKPGENRRAQVRQKGVGGPASAQGQFGRKADRWGHEHKPKHWIRVLTDLRHSPWRLLSLGSQKWHRLSSSKRVVQGCVFWGG